MKLLLLAASLRKDSVNKKLLVLAAQLLKAQGIAIDMADFAEFDVPLYHGDLNAELGLPHGAKQFIARMHAADGLIIASPEYNFSIPGTLKNLIDWVSREQPMPWLKQRVLLMSASPSLVGGNRGLWHTRVPLEACGAIVYSDMFSLASAYTAFAADGQFTDVSLQQRLKDNLTGFIHFVKALKAAGY